MGQSRSFDDSITNTPARFSAKGGGDLRITILGCLAYGCMRSEGPDAALKAAIELMDSVDDIASSAICRPDRETMEARFGLVLRIRDGDGVPKDPEMAHYIIEELSEYGYPPVLNYIAAMYLEGEHYPQSTLIGMEMLQEAADKKYPKSILNLSKIYRNEKYLEADEAEADELEDRAIGMAYVSAIICAGSALGKYPGTLSQR